MKIRKIMAKTALLTAVMSIAALPVVSSASCSYGSGHLYKGSCNYRYYCGYMGWYPHWNISGNSDDDISGDSNSSDTASGYESEVLSLVNQQRSAVGLPSLNYDAKVASAAQLKAEDMAENGYFSHTSPTYGSAFDMLKNAGVSYKSAGENIAKGQKNPTAVMNSWMNSSGHKANILGSSYTDIGIGYAVDSNGTAYWVQIFKG